MTPSVTFTNRLGEVLAPMLLWMRDIGFFEWYVYIPVMTASAVGLFLIVVRTTDRNGTFSDRPRRAIWLAAYFGLCFLATNGLAVGLKTLIVEELDYTTRVWFEAYPRTVAPLHRRRRPVVPGPHRAQQDGRTRLGPGPVRAARPAGGGTPSASTGCSTSRCPLAAPTMGLSGIVMCAAFALYNVDLYRRFVAPASRLAQLG